VVILAIKQFVAALPAGSPSQDPQGVLCSREASVKGDAHGRSQANVTRIAEALASLPASGFIPHHACAQPMSTGEYSTPICWSGQRGTMTCGIAAGRATLPATRPWPRQPQLRCCAAALLRCCLPARRPTLLVQHAQARQGRLPCSRNSRPKRTCCQRRCWCLLRLGWQVWA
jgi:hypothetical protein